MLSATLETERTRERRQRTGGEGGEKEGEKEREMWSTVTGTGRGGFTYHGQQLEQGQLTAIIISSYENSEIIIIIVSPII